MELDHHSPRNLATARLPRGGLPGDPTYCEWGAVVGGRIRRLRRSRGATLQDLGLAVVRGDGTHYSAGFVSRLERGKSSAPLYAYLAIADALKVDAGVLLGPDAATIEITDAGATLVRCVRELGLEPHEVIVRLLRDREPDPQLAPVDDHGFSAAVE